MKMAKVKKHEHKDGVATEVLPEASLSEVAIRKIKDDVEESLKTLTRPKSLKPERKKADKDAFKSRILVISPYGQINTFFDSRISNIVKGGYVDIIDKAETDKPPCINIAEREKLSPRPLWIIDFKKIMAMKPSPKHIAQGRLEILASVLKDYAGEMPKERDFYEEFLLANEISDSFIDKLVDR